MSASQVFARDGVVAVRGVLGAGQLAELAAALDENMAAPGPWANDYTPEGGGGRFFGDYVNWERIDGYRRLALSGPLAEVATELIGGPARFFHEHALVKEPGTDEVTPWHHDEPYYCVDVESNASLWVPLDPVPAAAGVRFVRGSHRWGRRFVPRRFVDAAAYADAGEGFELVPDVDALVDPDDVVAFDLEPGDVLAFHFRTLHDAPGTTTRRRAVSFRYVAADARFASRPWLHSPPFDPISPGQPLDDERFPLVAEHG
ncbi:MAG: phytanoyl-CoA dioxygenase family protein [Ilumatobacteraceae bacterium]